MACFYCGTQNADFRFFVNYMGHAGEVHLCGHCLEKIKNYTSGMAKALEEIQKHSPGAIPDGPVDIPAVPLNGYFSGKGERPRPLGQDPFPLDAGSDVKRRRLLDALRTKMQRAVEREDYESAAQLRDELHKMQQVNKV